MNVMQQEDASWKAQFPEAFRHGLFGVPRIDAGEIDVFPTVRDILEQVVRNVTATSAEMGCGTAKVNGIPVNDGSDDEGVPGGAERVTLERSIPDSPRSWKKTARLTLWAASPFVETCLTPPTKRRARVSLDHQQACQSNR
jgi:hypothetical protein